MSPSSTKPSRVRLSTARRRQPAASQQESRQPTPTLPCGIHLEAVSDLVREEVSQSPRVRRSKGPLQRRSATRHSPRRAGASERALPQARTTLGYTRILAPFDGVVTEKKADVGSLVSPGMPSSPWKTFTATDWKPPSTRPIYGTSAWDSRLPSSSTLGDKEIKGRVIEIVACGRRREPEFPGEN